MGGRVAAEDTSPQSWRAITGPTSGAAFETDLRLAWQIGSKPRVHRGLVRYNFRM